MMHLPIDLMLIVASQENQDRRDRAMRTSGLSERTQTDKSKERSGRNRLASRSHAYLVAVKFYRRLVAAQDREPSAFDDRQCCEL